jgi:hypothetical protein
MRFKSIAEFLALKGNDAPTTAERKLIEATQAGSECYLCDPADLVRPQEATDATRIRASLLRLLIIGGTPACNLYERGVTLFGGWIDGGLDLAYCTAKGRTVLAHCGFPDRPSIELARFQLLNLDDSAFPEGLHAMGIRVKASLFLRRITAARTVNMTDAKIGGDLDCRGARFDGGRDKKALQLTALNAQGIETAGTLTLESVTATGMINLAGANIGGQLDCEGATLDGGKGLAVLAQRMKVAKGLLFRELKQVKGRINLIAAHASDLVDDEQSWPRGQNQLMLDGFTYDRINGPTTFAARRDWLAAGSSWDEDFFPQPYTQFARVLRQMGHAGEARKVLKARESLLAAHLHSADRAAYQSALHGGPAEKGDAGKIGLRMTGAWLWSELTRRVAGHGYAPQFALYWSLFFATISFFAYFFFWRLGAMVPADAILLASPEWAAAVASNPKAPSHAWQGPAATHYETFYSLTYALDVFLPIVDLGQQSTWGQTTATWWGWSARLYTWALQIAGWVVTTLGVAAVTGVIQRNQPD